MTPEPIPQPPETPQSAPNPCCPHPKSHPIIFLLIAILLTAVGVYAGMQLEKRKVKVWVEPPLTEITPEPTQITDSTANWKIYANTTYGFEFKYPKEWIIFQNDESIILTPETLGENDEGKIFISFPQDDSLTSFFENTNVSTGSKNKEIYQEEKQLEILNGKGVVTRGGCCGLFGKHVFLKSNSNDGLIQLTLRGPIDKQIIKYDSIFDQILSTFKFTDNPSSLDPTVTWKTYKSDKYGISFKYPKEAKIMGDTNSQLFTIISENQAVSLLVSDNPNGYDVSEFLPKPTDYVSFSNVRINGIDFVLFNQDANYFSQQSQPLNGYLVKSGSYIIGLNFNKESESLINQILSTFKFTD